MAEFGPALFQYFANTVQFDNDGYVIPYQQKEYSKYQFSQDAEKAIETFKSAIFKLIMLRARNEAIINMKCKKESNSVLVNLQLELTDAHFHATDEKSHPHATPKAFSESRQKLRASIESANAPKYESNEYDVCSLNRSLGTQEIIHATFIPFTHDTIDGVDAADISRLLNDLEKPMTCGAPNSFLNCDLVKKELAEYVIGETSPCVDD